MIFDADNYSAGNFLEVSKVIGSKTMKEIVSQTSVILINETTSRNLFSLVTISLIYVIILDIVTDSKTEIGNEKLGLLRTDLL